MDRNFNCENGLDHEAADYISFEDFRKSAIAPEEIIQNFYDCINFASRIQCIDCENKCELYKKVMHDLIGLHSSDPARYYDYLTDVLCAFKDAIAGKETWLNLRL